MSSTTPPPRRRRIAGERRGRSAPEGFTTPRPTQESSAHEAREALAEDLEQLPPTSPATTSQWEVVEVEDSEPGPREDDADRDDDFLFGTDEEDDARRTSGWWGSRASLFVLSGLLAVLLTLVALAALGLLGTDGLEDLDEAEAVARTERTAPAAAEAAAAAILAYDHTSLDADQATAVQFMTEEFAAKYSDTFEKVVRPAAEQTRAKVTATVQASSIVRATEDTARVLLFVDQATTSTANDRPQIALNRVEMSLVRDGDSWLVDNITSY